MLKGPGTSLPVSVVKRRTAGTPDGHESDDGDGSADTTDVIGVGVHPKDVTSVAIAASSPSLRIST